MEYGVDIAVPGTKRLRPLKGQEHEGLIDGYFPEHVSCVKFLSEGGYLLQNGARSYPDAGSHPEYATAPARGYVNTVCQDAAGERHMYGMLQHAVKTKKIADFRLYKDVIDDRKMAWGFHANYCLDATRIKINPEALKPLLGLLVSATAFTGAGLVYRREDGVGQFAPGQKMLAINADISQYTLHTKAIINTRDEPHADSERYRRGHITSGDPHLSAWALFMQLGTTSWGYRLLEHGMAPEIGGQLQEPVAAANAIAADPTLNYKIELEGKTISTVDMQWEYLARAWDLRDRDGASWEDTFVLQEWERVLGELEAYRDGQTSLEPLVDRVEWATRLHICQKILERNEIDPEDPNAFSYYKVRQFYRQSVTIGSSVLKRLREGQWSEWSPDELMRRKIAGEEGEEAAKAFKGGIVGTCMETPPPGTRAQIHGDFIKHVKKNKLPHAKANWTQIRTPGGQYIELSDPYASQNKEVDRLLGRKAA
jgi:proteasome accessory factor A